MAQLTKPSFAAGELSPSLYSRTDLAKYHIGVRTMLNWYVHPQGGASNCPGTAWVGEVLDNTEVGRLIAFQFSTVDSYALEFGNETMRVIRNGSYVLETAHTITAITKADPSVVTYTGSDPSNGDRVYISSPIGMTELNGRFFTVAGVNTGANTFQLTDLDGENVDTSGYGTYNTGGTWARVYTLETPYLSSELDTLEYEQSADTLTLVHKSHRPRKLTRTSHSDWTLTVISFAPLQTPPTDVRSTSSGTTHYYVMTAINDETGEESLQSDEAGSSSETSTISCKKMDGCSLYSVYKRKNGVYGFIGTAQRATGDVRVKFTDATIVPDTSTTPPQQKNQFGDGIFTEVTIDAAGSGYVAPTARLVNNGVTVTPITLTVGGSGEILTAVPDDTGQKIGPTAYIEITDGAGVDAVLRLNFTADGGSLQVATDSEGNPVYEPTLVLSSVTVVDGGSGYASGAVVRAHYYGAPTYADVVDPGGMELTATVTAGAVVSVAVTDPGTMTFVDYPGYGLPVASVIDSAGTGAILTAERDPDDTGNPGVTTYHDGRQWFASSIRQPQTMWGSVAGAFNNMNQSQPTRDSDAITRTLASRQVNEIRHMISLSNGMVVLTSGAEWKISAGQADVITPAQFVARPQSYNGSSYIRPIVANDTLLYIPPNNKKVRSLQYQWAQDAWSGTDLSLLAGHLFDKNSITDWAYARDPDSICWTVRDDGVALAFTFLPEQQVYAWSRRTTTNGAFESVCAVQEDNETAVYFIVRRTINGVTRRYVERMQSRVFATIKEAWFLDCALQYEGRRTDIIGGLWHLIGEQVWALADGIVRGPFTVSVDAQITLPALASFVTVGKIIPDADLELLDIDGQDQAGTWTGRRKKISHLTVALKDSANSGMVAGPSGGQGSPTLYALKPKDPINPLAAAASSAPALITDYMHTITAPQWDWHGRALFRVRNSPLPYTITGITPEVVPGG